MPKYLCAPLALLALAAAGCGDSRPSQKEFVADLDAICKKSEQELLKLDKPKTSKQLAKFVRESREIADESFERAAKLELPDEDKGGFEDYIKKSKDSLTALDELEQAAEQNNRPEFERIIKETAEENDKRDAQAKKLGLKDCGSG